MYMQAAAGGPASLRLSGDAARRRPACLTSFKVMLDLLKRNIQETEIKKIVERRNLNNKKEEKPYVNLKIDPV
ncbi:Heat Shock Protein Beta-6 [Manis pentadactyla]|nr:Heat Shock Protein Beta-6 [Manis pentadactyla]